MLHGPRARNLQEVVERQCRRREILREHRTKQDKPIHWPIITVEREFGDCGEALGRILAEKTGFTFGDGELVHAVADESGAKKGSRSRAGPHRWARGGA